MKLGPFAIAFVLLASCCKSGDKCSAPAPTTTTDAAVSDAKVTDNSKYDQIADKCLAACTKLKDLGCPEGEPTAGGMVCVDFCHEEEAKGIVLLHPACVASSVVLMCQDMPKCKQQ